MCMRWVLPWLLRVKHTPPCSGYCIVILPCYCVRGFKIEIHTALLDPVVKAAEPHLCA